MRLGQPGDGSFGLIAKLVMPWVSLLIDFLMIQFCLFVIFLLSARVIGKLMT